MAINPLIALVAQAAGVPMAQAGAEQAPPAQETAPIVVTGGQDMQEPIPGMDNGMVLEDAQYAQQQAPQRKGLFGMKGTLRDVLGTVGDAFLVQSGNNPIYSGIRRNERMADAMAGFSQNPQAAMERLAAAGFGDEAQKLAEQQRLRLAQNLKEREFGLEAQGADTDRLKEGSEMFARIIGAANPTTYGQMVPLLQKIKTAYNLGDEFAIPEEFDANYAQSMAYGGMPTSRQVSAQQADQRIGISQQNADNNTRRTDAYVARPAPVPRSKTPTEFLEELMAKPPSQRTPEEQAYVDMKTTRGDGGPRRNRDAPPPPSNRMGRFRPIN